MYRDADDPPSDERRRTRQRAQIMLAVGLALACAGLALTAHAVFGGRAGQVPATVGPRLEIVPKKVNLGRVLQTDVPTATVTMRNVGDAPLVIERIESS